MFQVLNARILRFINQRDTYLAGTQQTTDDRTQEAIFTREIV